MVIGVLTVELSIDDAFSLKEKRMVLNRIRDRVRQKFNVAIAEVEDNESWNHACLGVVTVSNERRYSNQVLSKVVELIESEHDCRLEDFTIEFL
jgi:uncharacterized protein YlxP (DUF503 family)